MIKFTDVLRRETSINPKYVVEVRIESDTFVDGTEFNIAIIDSRGNITRGMISKNKAEIEAQLAEIEAKIDEYNKGRG